MKYLYGASVQGIQKFIFETNRLEEIVGASEIVEYICTELYKKEDKSSEYNVILSAAGNIRIIADTTTEISELVKEFPKKVSEYAPGISISQAVVECEDPECSESIAKLEEKLKEQRNKPIRPIEITALGIERSRRTGKPASKFKKINKSKDKEAIDYATQKKIDESKKTSLIDKLKKDAIENFTKEMEELTHKDHSNWLAVIHADGNSIGKIIQNLKDYDIKIREFSDKLNKVTEIAAKTAFLEVIEEKEKNDKNEFYPIRPIVIGGDDLTVICRADLALDFIKVYLKAFQDEGIKQFSNKINLTASAGIAFVKPSYPFHYAVDLAEELCSEAKKKSKQPENVKNGLIPASVSFHKIQSSFMDSYSEIKDRELYAKESSVSFVNGPYFLEDIENLQKMVKKILEKDSPKSGIRKWLNELHRSKDSAKQLMDRTIEITKMNHKEKGEEFVNELGLKNAIKKDKTHLYDVLTIASLQNTE